MIVTEILAILLLVHHQIASWSIVKAVHPLSDGSDELFDKVLWPAAENNHHELSPETQHRNRHHHHSRAKYIWENGPQESGPRQPLSIIDDHHEGEAGLERGPSSPLQTETEVQERGSPFRGASRYRHLAPQSASDPQQHHGSYVAKDRFWHNGRLHHQTDWCSKDCESAASNSSHHHGHHANRLICASDGRLYRSMCELKRHSCRHNVRLRRRPITFCPERDPIVAAVTANLEIGSTQTMADHDRVRIVELKKLCRAHEYAQMKRLMFDEFNGNIGSMFRYYDVNADNYIEAHELWPTASGDTSHDGKLIYAQVWDNHTSKCPQDNSAEDGHSDHSKCWYFLDFVFQPQYSENPCSLSHMMLFDLKHPKHRFDYESFAAAFSNFITNNVTTTKDSKHRSVKKSTKIIIGLGDDVDLKCRAELTTGSRDNIDGANHVINDNYDGDGYNDDDNDVDYLGVNNDLRGARCIWTRYNSNLAASKDPHVSIREQRREKERQRTEKGAIRNSEEDFQLRITEAQLYLSGQFRCTCHFQELAVDFEHTYHLQVLAKPQVKVLPHHQWSLQNSRISFECQYDQINTNSESDDSRNGSNQSNDSPRDIPVPQIHNAATDHQDELKLQFGLAIEWTQGDQILDERKHLMNQNGLKFERRKDLSLNQLFESSKGLKDSFDDDMGANDDPLDDYQTGSCNTTSRASITTAHSRLTLENLQACDSGQYTCRIALPQRTTSNPTVPIVAQDSGHLMVQDKPRDNGEASFMQTQTAINEEKDISQLWILHENGVSIYKVQDDDGREMELVRHIDGHSSISAEVEGNYNQLTLCGGLNSEQGVICEWSDNAVSIKVDHRRGNDNDKGPRQRRKYVYVGQPNLNRLVVFDGLKFEVVAIINTEPQPRRLHLYEPNRIHLSKWVRRRLSPIGNARWGSAIGTRAHPAESTPQESRLYSSVPVVGGPASTISDEHTETTNSNVNKTIGGSERDKRAASSHTNSPEPQLVQHDIWLLCYGQPLVPLDPSSSSDHYHRPPGSSAEGSANSSSASGLQSANGSSSPQMASTSSVIRQSFRLQTQTPDSIKPFEPRLSVGGAGAVFAPFAWPSNIWLPSNGGISSGLRIGNGNKEAQLRNRKSVHIIQSTFLQSGLSGEGSVHSHTSGDGLEHQQARNFTAVDEFKRTSVISTHHIYTGAGSSLRSSKHLYFNAVGSPTSTSSLPLHRMSFLASGRRARYDLIQDLFVPQKPYSLKKSPEYKIHYAYVTHYDEKRLFRVSMDSYRYDREIDLQDCDPIHALTTAQGLVVIQCRAPISHSLIGQLVLDQLTASRIEFNANIRAQESHLSPDNRYLVSIFHNTTPMSPTTAQASGQGPGEVSGPESNNNSAASSSDEQQSREAAGKQTQRHSSIVYVQTVTIDGLRLQYEIKTLFEISQCSFVWKDGYYAAIFVTSNRKDQQSEILSLRLIDSRLELMARVPGLVGTARHKDQLIVSPELRLAALTTNRGTFVIDLVENRVSQSIRPRHLMPPTLLWV